MRFAHVGTGCLSFFTCYNVKELNFSLLVPSGLLIMWFIILFPLILLVAYSYKLSEAFEYEDGCG